VVKSCLNFMIRSPLSVMVSRGVWAKLLFCGQTRLQTSMFGCFKDGVSIVYQLIGTNSMQEKSVVE